MSFDCWISVNFWSEKETWMASINDRGLVYEFEVERRQTAGYILQFG